MLMQDSILLHLECMLTFLYMDVHDMLLIIHMTWLYKLYNKKLNMNMVYHFSGFQKALP